MIAACPGSLQAAQQAACTGCSTLHAPGKLLSRIARQLRKARGDGDAQAQHQQVKAAKCLAHAATQQRLQVAAARVGRVRA